jgi:hypothetical protein
MSISISLGSSSSDIENLMKTKESLVLLLNLLKDPLSNIDVDDTDELRKKISNLISWYENILHILYTGGSPQELNSEFFQV